MLGSGSEEHQAITSALPGSPLGRLVRPFLRFMEVESASGGLLLACTLVALVLSNSCWAADFAEIWKLPLAIVIGDFELHETLGHAINDGLMTIFFFVVGLEIKRELVTGELRDPRQAALPAMAALGGMAVPAAVFLALHWNQPGEPGWGIPMATDIAFVVGFLALLGSRVPLGLKIFLLSLAIVDDIGAVLVIALFYSSGVSWAALLAAGAGFGMAYFFNRIGVRRVTIYVVLGAAIWLCFLKSGVHPTVAGVLLGLLTPASAWVGARALGDVLAAAAQRIGNPDAPSEPELWAKVATTAREAASPLERLELAFHPWVAFVIMPLFALANAGVPLAFETLGDPVAVAVACGLALGKPIGIFGFSWLAVKSGLARLPAGVDWRVMLGAGCLAGVGFTMSLFIAGLALSTELLDAGKIGTLAGSTLSAVLGVTLLVWFLPRRGVQPAESREPQRT
jgi:NhaA family Na+:H+ antiporter